MGRTPRFAVALAAAGALAGCATAGPDFEGPSPPSGAANEAYLAPSEAAPAEVRLDPQARTSGTWWQALGSTKLDALVSEALQASPTLVEARATLARFQAEARAESAERGPQADASAQAERRRFNSQSFGFDGFPNSTFNLFSIGARVSYDLDLFGGQRRRAEASAALAEQVAHEAEAAYVTLTSDIALQAIRAAGLSAEISALEQVAAEDRMLVELSRTAQSLGSEAPSASTGVRAQLAEDEAALAPLRKELAAARHQLARLAGKAPADWRGDLPALAEFQAVASAPIAVPSALVRARPDILAAEAELHAATAEIGVAIAAQYPNIRITSDFTQTTGHPGRLFNYSASGWNVISGLSAPLFDGGRRKADRRAAEAEAEAALARYQETVLRAFNQVSDALSALQADGEHIRARAFAVQVAEAQLNDAVTAERLGGAARIDVVETRRRLARAHRLLHQARAQRLSDLVSLLAATAGGRPGT